MISPRLGHHLPPDYQVVNLQTLYIAITRTGHRDCHFQARAQLSIAIVISSQLGDETTGGVSQFVENFGYISHFFLQPWIGLTWARTTRHWLGVKSMKILGDNCVRFWSNCVKRQVLGGAEGGLVPTSWCHDVSPVTVNQGVNCRAVACVSDV